MKYVLSLISLVLLNACCDRCEQDFNFVEYKVYANVQKDGQRISNEYDSAYAIGLKDTIFNYKLDRFSLFADSAFGLCLNIHKDTTAFVFVDKHQDTDTVYLSYSRGFRSGSYEYILEIKDLKITALSTRLSKDSSSVFSLNQVYNGYKLNLVRK